MTARSYHCDLAWVVDGVAGEPAVSERVRITTADGRIIDITVDVAAGPDDVHLRGFTIPGLANAHSHAFQRALRSRTHSGPGSFWTWRDLMYRVAGRLEPDSYHRLARAVFGEMVLAGITAVGEFHYLHHRQDGGRYEDPNAMGEALIAAAADVGLRLTLLDTLYLHGGLDGGVRFPPNPVQRRFSDGSPNAWAERVSSITPPAHTRIGAAVHSVRAVDPVSIAAAAAWAEAGDAVLHAHVSEQPVENEQCAIAHGCSPVALLDDAGALGPRFTAVHATHVGDDDVSRLARTGSGVCLCPTTERDLGDGIGPSRLLRAAGVPLSLGTDSHAVIDMLEEARAVELDQRLASGERGVHPCAELLGAATATGHRALGWPDAGLLEVGARADLVSIELDSVRTAGAGAESALGSAVFAAAPADIHHVVIDGRVVVEAHHHRALEVAPALAAAIQEVTEE